MNSFVERRLVRPLKAFLIQGATPRKLACSVACGIVCGLFPVMGATTLLCTVMALLFGLNLPATQLVNYFIYPLQLALIVPFIRAGEFLLHVESTRLSLRQMIAIFHQDPIQGLHLLWRLALHGVFAWALLAPVVFAAAYCIFLPPLARIAESIARPRKSAAVTP